MVTYTSIYDISPVKQIIRPITYFAAIKCSNLGAYYGNMELTPNPVNNNPLILTSWAKADNFYRLAVLLVIE